MTEIDLDKRDYNGEAANGLGNHLHAARKGIERRRRIYRDHKRPFDTNAHIFLWRNNITYQEALLNAMLTMLRPTKVGTTTGRWREMSQASQIITRVFFNQVIRAGRSVTVSDIESRLMSDAAVEYDRNTIRDVLNYGVELGLLTKSETDGKKSHKYSATKTLYEEMFERMLVKVTDPAVVHFARLVLTYNSMTKIGENTIQLEEDGLQDFGPTETVQNDVCAGKYDAVIERLLAEEDAVNADGIEIFRGANMSTDE